MVLPEHKTNLSVEEPSSENRIWHHWFNVRIRQFMILEILLMISLIMIFYRLQTISNQNDQVIEMVSFESKIFISFNSLHVSSMKSQVTMLERKVMNGKPNENSTPLEQSIADVLKNLKMEQPINFSKQSKTEKLVTPHPPFNPSNNISIFKKVSFILNAADYLRGASVDNAQSSRSNLKPIIGYDQSNLVLLDRPQPPPHKAWCSNEHNPVLTINLAEYIKPKYVSYQHSKSHNQTIPSSTPRTYDVVACLDFYCQNWKPLVSNCKYNSQFGLIGTEQICNISSRPDVPLIGKVQFRFHENYGDSKMTCVHLVRVYGETMKPVKVQKTKNLASEQLCNDLKWYYHNSYFKYTLVSKSCSKLYENDCCSDCPECCEECSITDYNGSNVTWVVAWTLLGFAYLVLFVVIIFLCYGCITGRTGR
ncbi:hypothetical protein B9Z55_012870 [Caenorhabditis nigoni]|uniref:SUN domain-containing protein n=1 Tax=Caenorhabditis nigoni TaxID=1611254 RepID=A0A2G5TZD5_9PELO|nr:hypothetical protein B9Z55_012870 [Caenorhabditis nigoni]